ncbi:MAG: DNA-3-methyladenine glycosylase [Opitutae bacterium]|nr:DNA-3-methyladenine glycosylase [Opitutae bacterium]
MATYFRYGEKEIAYLKRADARLSYAIDKIGKVRRQVIPDLFAALVHSIVGQQITTKAHETIWQRMQAGIVAITPATMSALAPEELQGFGISLRKAGYIRGIAQKVLSGEFDIAALNSMSDDEVCAQLSTLKGIGVWSAEMLMIFSMQRPNVLSFGDLGILRGLRMLYHREKIDHQAFEKYRRRFSPYCSVASLYLWSVAGGAIPELKGPTTNPKSHHQAKFSPPTLFHHQPKFSPPTLFHH